MNKGERHTRQRRLHFITKKCGFSISERLTYKLSRSVRSTQCYVRRRLEPDGLREAKREVAYAHPRYGYRRMHSMVVLVCENGPEFTSLERPHSSLGNQTPNEYERTWRAAA